MAAAVAALAAQQHALQVQEVTDAFRLAGATAPERARTLAELRIAHAHAAESLATAGLLRPGAAPDSWYLDEAAVVAQRQARARRARSRPLAIVIGVLAGLLVAALFVMWTYRRGG
jgi:hypothetical protein